MITQWENECISLAILSLGRVMIAHWENKSILWCVLPVARIMIDQWGEWMYLIVCPLGGPGHDSSVGEWMYLTVCPFCRPGHGRSVGKWTNFIVWRSVARVQFPAVVEYFKRQQTDNGQRKNWRLWNSVIWYPHRSITDNLFVCYRCVCQLWSCLQKQRWYYRSFEEGEVLKVSHLAKSVSFPIR